MATDFDPNKLFNQVTKALQEDDSNKLSELLEEDTPLDEEQADDPLLEDAPEDEDVGNEEEDEPEVDEPEGTPEPDEPPAKAGDDKEDPIADLRAQLTAMQRENQALKSQAGRVPHVQRRLDELDKKLSQLMAAPSSQASAKITPKVDELLKDVEDTDPTLASALKQALVTAVEGIDEEQRSREIENLKMLRQREEEAYQAEEAKRLLEMYPMAPEVFANPHWAAWKKEQPDHILKLATSNNADAVALALDLFARDMQARYPELAPKQADERANKVEEERQRKKQTAANVDRPNAPAKGRGPQNPEALFAKFSEEIRKEISGG